MENIGQMTKPLEAKLQIAMAEVKKLKTAINCYYEAMGQPAKYLDVEQESIQGALPRPDEYFGRPLATVVTEALEKRRRANLGSATLDELFKELTTGGFKFVGKNEGVQKRGLAISMGKNTKFFKLDNETWGLKVWYPSAKEPQKADTTPEPVVENDDSEELEL